MIFAYDVTQTQTNTTPSPKFGGLYAQYWWLPRSRKSHSLQRFRPRGDRQCHKKGRTHSSICACCQTQSSCFFWVAISSWCTAWLGKMRRRNCYWYFTNNWDVWSWRSADATRFTGVSIFSWFVPSGNFPWLQIWNTCSCPSAYHLRILIGMCTYLIEHAYFI